MSSMVQGALPRVVGALLGEADPSPRPGLPGLRAIPLAPLEDAGRVAAVDGGQSIVTDLGSCGVIAVRAGYTLRRPGDHYADETTYEAVHAVARRSLETQWAALLRQRGWPFEAAPSAANGLQWVRAWCEAERSLAERDAARRALRHLARGDLLLLDGSLDEAAPAALDVAQEATRQGVSVAAVSKDTSLTLGGTLPFTLEVEDWARQNAAPPAFAVDVTAPLRGPSEIQTWGVRWDSRAPVHRVDVASAAGVDPTGIFRRIHALCRDVAYPGYPYPLARVHDRAHYGDGDGLDLKRQLEALVAQRRGSLFSLRLFGRGRDVLALGG